MIPVYGKINEDEVLLGNIAIPYEDEVLLGNAAILYRYSYPCFNTYSEVKSGKYVYTITLNKVDIVDNSEWNVLMSVCTPDFDYLEFDINSDTFFRADKDEYVIEPSMFFRADKAEYVIEPKKI
jgi:hypothetical protein